MPAKNSPAPPHARFVAGVGVGAVALLALAIWFSRQGRERAAGFAGVGAFVLAVWWGLAALGGREQRTKAAQEALRQQFPQEPWRWRTDWHNGRIESGTRATAMVQAWMGLACLGLSAPGVWAIPEELRSGNPAILLVLIFWLIGLGLLAAAWRRRRQYRRHGKVEFLPTPLPGSVGGYLGGVITIQRGAVAAGDARLDLRCVHATVDEGGRDRHPRESIRWETDALVVVEPAPDGRVHDLLVLFHIPIEALPTDERNPEDRILWRLEFTLPLTGGAKLTASFEVPVFVTGETAPAPTDARPLLEEYRARSAEDFMRTAGVTEERIADARVWRFQQPAARRVAMVVAGIGLILAAIGWMVPVGVIRWGFGGFALLLGWSALGLGWHRSELWLREHSIEVRRHTWRGTRRWLIKRAEVGDLKLEKSMEFGGRRFFRLKLVGTPGVDPATPHPLEHFAARKARYRWRAGQKKRGASPDDVKKALAQTPRFELEAAACLAETQAADRVRDYLLTALVE